MAQFLLPDGQVLDDPTGLLDVDRLAAMGATSYDPGQSQAATQVVRPNPAQGVGGASAYGGPPEPEPAPATAPQEGGTSAPPQTSVVQAPPQPEAPKPAGFPEFAAPAPVRAPAPMRATPAAPATPKADPLMQRAQELQERESELAIDARLLQQQKMDADLQVSRAQIATEQEQARLLEQDVARQRAAAEEIEREVARKHQRIAETAQTAADQRIDYDKYWSDRGNFARAMGALAILVGTQSSRGNVGKELIDQAIEREVKQQEFQAEQAWRANAEARNQYADYLESHGSPKAARESLRAVLYGQMEHERKVQLMNAGLSRQEAESDEVLKGMSMARSQALLEGEKAALAAAIKEREAQAAARAAAARSQELDPRKRQRVLMSNGQPVGMVIGASAEKYQAKLDALDRIDQNLNRLKQIEDQTSLAYRAATPGNDAWRQWKAVQTDTVLAIKDAEQLGALDKGALEVASNLIPGPGNLNSYAGIQEMLEINKRKREAVLQQAVLADTPDLPTAAPPTPRGVEEQ